MVVALSARSNCSITNSRSPTDAARTGSIPAFQFINARSIKVMSEKINLNSAQKPAVESGEPYEWERCTVRLSITFLPTETNEGERQIIIGCNTHSDPPLIESVCETELTGLPPLITELLNKLRQRMPEQAALAEARRQAETAAEEKAKLARQQNEARIKAAGQRYRDKGSQSQTVAPAVVTNELREIVAVENSESSAVENNTTLILTNGKQQSLFG
jgi:hypothetical protein